MSQDLFEAFASSNVPRDRHDSQSRATTPAAPCPRISSGASRHEIFLSPVVKAASESTREVLQAGENQDDDDWGDFEGPASGMAPVSLDMRASPANQSKVRLDTELFNKSAHVQLGKPHEDAIVSAKRDEGVPSAAFQNSNVLFDAELDVPSEGDDSFGDYEGSAAGQPAVLPLVDLLGLEQDDAAPQVVVSSRRPAQNALLGSDKRSVTPVVSIQSEQASSSYRRVSTAKKEPSIVRTSPPSTPSTTPPLARRDDSNTEPPRLLASSNRSLAATMLPARMVEVDEPWDEFGALDGTSCKMHGSKEVRKQAFTAPKTSHSVQEPNDDLPPANIPPPAVLLSIFPTVFSSSEKEFFQPLSNQSQSARESTYVDMQTIEFLKGYLLLGVVCARIIAGRKLRWKRDSFLSQSMRIGPAASGKLAGMKVTSLNKAEASREDRETADVLRAWRNHVGRLRAAVAEVKRCSGTEIGPLPDIKEVMPIRTASEHEGGVHSSKPCGLCGLKRNERVGKVDFEVQDSFGEWWVDSTNMHRGKSLPPVSTTNNVKN